MPLSADQIDRFNKEVFDLVSPSADEEEIAAALAAVLEEFSQDIVSYVEAIAFTPNGRGQGVDEWRVPSAAELRARFDSELRSSLSDVAGTRANEVMSKAIDRLSEIAEVEPEDAGSEFVAAVIASFLTPATGDSPADIWAQVHRRLRDEYRKGSSVSDATENVRALLYGRDDDEIKEKAAEYRSKAEDAENDEDAEYFQKRASALSAEDAGWVEWRSETIATALATGIIGAGVYSLASQYDLSASKTWIHMGDDRVRPAHLLIGGETVDVTAQFSNGLRYPGDVSGPLGEWMNCRCVLFLDGGNLRNVDPEEIEELDDGAIFAAAGKGAPVEFFDVPSMVEDDTAFVGEANEDGYRRIYGRAWFWDQCLLHGEQERICRTPREFASDDDGYLFFHTLSNFIASDGSRPNPGPMIFGHTGAGTAEQAKQSADNPANVKAVVRIHEDELGATYSGVVLPHVSESEAAMIPATQVSPEWWRIRPQSPLRLSTLSFVALGALRQNSEALMAAAKSQELCVTGANEDPEITAPLPEMSFEEKIADDIETIKKAVVFEPDPANELEKTEEISEEEEEDHSEAVLERVQLFIENHVEDLSVRKYVERLRERDE